MICKKRFPVSIFYKSIAGRYLPVRVADGPITARCRFIKNASRVNAMQRYCDMWHLKINAAKTRLSYFQKVN